MNDHDTRERDCDGIDTSHRTCDCDRLNRRRFIVASGAAGVAALAGCSGGEPDDGPAPEPVSLADGKQCDACGMVIGEHAGPNGQLFYREHGPEAHDGPAWFDSLKGCLFPYYFEHEQRDWDERAVYVTDYSTVDYEVSTTEGRTYIGTATAPETFARADEVTFVVDSGVEGAMGPDFVPFSDDGDAEAFQSAYGGRQVAFEDVTPEMLA